ncbi:conserved hypothetical protein [Methylocella silvestris BL2]|uniref:Bacteriophage protein n=1 Tax=Methylocella silvestris (strain DSM 15510 / CIP 108128 / LMG 27833 / NCIMB 13906 / BL2) TaxID=395965 RepID=B8EKW7_METSB|nr:hypothetical protein [Methylocella silvestris]ACK51995.1 conserved hypothetical protein [Methylocella silvestris BL2]
MTRQWIRDCRLTVGDGKTALDLSNMRIRFQVHQDTLQSCNIADIFVTNLAETTAQKLMAKEFTRVVLEAGYKGNRGVIFQGTLIQPRKGRENPVDTYLALRCSDGDQAYNYAFVSKTLAAGATPKDILRTCTDAMKEHGSSIGYFPDDFGGNLKYPRAVTMFGPAKQYLRTLAQSNDCQWSIQGGKVDMVPNNGHKPGAAFVLNTTTGLIGMPEETTDGIYVKCLLNPAIRVNTLLQINESSINRAALDLSNQGYPNSDKLLMQTGVKDGIYKVLSIDWEGDTRGNPWYCDIVCIGAKTGDPSPGQIGKGRG